MKRRSFIIALIAGALLATGFSGQALAHQGKRGFNVDRKVAKMTKHLELDDAQAAKVRTILESKKDQFKAIKSQNLEREEKRAQMRELRKSTRDEIAQVLNDDQKAKLQKMKKRKHQRRGKHKGPFSEKRIEKTAERLGLNESQVTQIKSIVADAKAERETILEAAGGDRSAARSELRDHRKKVRSKIEGVMTPEQLEKAKELRQKRRGHRGKRHDG